MPTPKELDDNPEEAQTIFFPGFSDRLNILIDRSDVELPPLDNGRAIAFAALFNMSKSRAADWLKRNNPPKPIFLRKVTEYFFNRSNITDSTVEHVEAWLKYGPTIVADPFLTFPFNDNNVLLCCNLIADVANGLHLTASQYDLEKVVRLTLDTLRAYSINDVAQVEPGIMLLIRRHIEDSLR